MMLIDLNMKNAFAQTQKEPTKVVGLLEAINEN